MENTQVSSSRGFAQPDPNAEISVGDQGGLMDLPNNDYEEYLAFGSDVYKNALLGMSNSVPKNNRLAPPVSDIVYADPANWHPCTTGINAGTRVNNTTVSYNGALNVFRKFMTQ